MMNLGLVFNTIGDFPVLHRSLLKILLNPWLRLFGWEISTDLTKKGHDWVIIRITWKKTERARKLSFSWNYARPSYYEVRKIRRIW